MPVLHSEMLKNPLNGYPVRTTRVLPTNYLGFCLRPFIFPVGKNGILTSFRLYSRFGYKIAWILRYRPVSIAVGKGVLSYFRLHPRFGYKILGS